jgi:hypothetical protein
MIARLKANRNVTRAGLTDAVYVTSGLLYHDAVHGYSLPGRCSRLAQVLTDSIVGTVRIIVFR